LTGSWPRDFGVFTPPTDQRLNPEIEDTQILFTIPGQRFQILAGSRTEINRLLLTNSTVGDEKGTGYVAPGGKDSGGRSAMAISGRFKSLPLNSAQDICKRA
jgi:hypothetical protein